MSTREATCFVEDVISAPQTELFILWQQVLNTSSSSFTTDTSTRIWLWSGTRSCNSCVLVNVAKAVSNDSIIASLFPATDLFCSLLTSAERAFGRAAFWQDSSVETASGSVEDTVCVYTLNTTGSPSVSNTASA